AAVIETKDGRVYLPSTSEMEEVAQDAKAAWAPEGTLVADARAFTPTLYGLERWSDLFTPRQLAALTTMSDLVREIRPHVERDALAVALPNDGTSIADGGTGAASYAGVLATYLAFSADKTTEYACTLVPWYSKEDRPKGLFARQAIPMVWDYA